MIAPMALRHRIIGLIWAAVLVIAVQFVPSIASAHSGHEHHAEKWIPVFGDNDATTREQGNQTEIGLIGQGT